jgi:hypothetical protein
MDRLRQSRILLAATAAIAAPLAAQSAPGPASDHWSWTVAPYLLMPTMSGDLQIGNMATVNVDAGANTIFSHLQFGAMLYVQARKGDWAFALDGIYMDLAQDISPSPDPTTGGTIVGSVNVTQGALEGFAFWRAQKHVEAALGVLVNRVSSSGDFEALFTSGGIGIAIPFSSDRGATWAVPVAGVRWTPVDGKRWHVVVFGDVGTLGSDNWTWQLAPSAGYRFNDLLELSMQYRVLSLHYQTAGPGGPGALYVGPFLYDMDIYGPEIALGFHF